MARSFLKAMKMPSSFWGEAIRHSIYILNRLPTRAVSGITPYEAWSGEKPQVGHIRVFGCTAYMKVPSVNLRKLDDRSRAVVNLGKEPGTKAYRLYDLATKKVLVSRDVCFDKEKPWPWSQETNEADVPLGTFTVVNCDSREMQLEAESTMPESDGEGNQTADSGNTESDTDSEPRHFRSLRDIYDNTDEIEIEDEELLLMGVDEPGNYRQAARDVNWRKAMNQEMESVEENKTWILTEQPPGRKAIDLKWIYKLKRDATGEVVKHKARIVAKGYVQRHGVDFEEIFAPVTRIETVRMLLALAAKNNWEVHHLDVKIVFLNGEEIYVTQPEGFVKRGKEHLVYRLFKALYGLRQAPRAWYSKLNKCLLEIGFERCPFETAVYSKKVGNEVLIIAIYVDDILVTGANQMMIKDFKEKMNGRFDMTDLGKLKYYLGIEVEQGPGFVELK